MLARLPHQLHVSQRAGLCDDLAGDYHQDMSDELNGTHVEAPAPAEDAPCEDCATSGEKILAVAAALFGVLVLIMAVDIFTGGKITGFLPSKASQ